MSASVQPAQDSQCPSLKTTVTHAPSVTTAQLVHTSPVSAQLATMQRLTAPKHLKAVFLAKSTSITICQDRVAADNADPPPNPSAMLRRVSVWVQTAHSSRVSVPVNASKATNLRMTNQTLTQQRTVKPSSPKSVHLNTRWISSVSVLTWSSRKLCAKANAPQESKAPSSQALVCVSASSRTTSWKSVTPLALRLFNSHLWMRTES